MGTAAATRAVVAGSGGLGGNSSYSGGGDGRLSQPARATWAARGGGAAFHGKAPAAARVVVPFACW